MPNGAQALMKTLVDAGIEVCFSNPGTSEMHFVAALDNEPKMRAVLALFEGVATGAADGYARMADKPAATLLHLGCGLGNGLANLHNARKGRVPLVNIVGDHATYHVKYDAQLQSDIETVARNVSPGFVRTSKSTTELCRDAADAIVVARQRQVATLILPADVSWGEGGMPCPVPPPAALPVAGRCHRGCGGQRHPLRRKSRAAARRPCLARAEPAGCGTDCGAQWRPPCWRKPSPPASNVVPACPPWSGLLIWPSWPACSWRM
jgi:thiamine pyrophosphate-dependent acetolactate synthase large subunit-like protein